MNVSVVIPNYNGARFLNECLKSINRKSILEIIVIDNGSSDESVEIILENHPDVILIQNKKNYGFAKAVNQGILKANGEYVFLFNNDAILADEYVISRLVNEIETDDNIFSVSCKMIQWPDKSLIDDAGDEYTILGWTKRVGYGKSIENYTKSRDTFSACAGAALYKRSLLIDVGLFDGEFFAYMEDVDLSFRARLSGYNIRYCADALVYHYGSGTSGSQYNSFKTRIAAKNNIFVVYKNMVWPILLVNFIFLCFGFFIKTLFFMKKGYGKLYLSGLKEGFKKRSKVSRRKFKSSEIRYYIDVELFMIKNTFKFLFY